MLNMTSQRWLTDADFAPNSPSKSLWFHYLVVIVPNAVQWTRNASLYITGGENDHGGSIPKSNDEDIVRVLVSVWLSTLLIPRIGLLVLTPLP